MSDAFNIRPTTEDLVISTQELKDFFLFGISDTDDNGKPFPASMYEFYIRSAQEYIEKEIPGICLCQTDIANESHDYYLNDYMAYSFVKLFRFPVLSVSAVGLQFPTSSNVLQFNTEWFRTESNGAQVNLVPTQGSISSMLMSQGGAFLPLLYQGQSSLPHLVKVSYRAGFEKGKIPHQLKEVIGMKAALGPLNIAGDLIAGAGIASKSLSLDGLSQSVSTTSSATNAGYGARIITYNKEIKERMRHLREFYGGISMVVS